VTSVSPRPQSLLAVPQAAFSRQASATARMSTKWRGVSKEIRNAHKIRNREEQKSSQGEETPPPPDLAGQRRPMEEEEHEALPPQKQSRDEPNTQMEVESNLEQLYLDNDELAYNTERKLDKQRKFHAQHDLAAEEQKRANETKEKAKDTSQWKIILSAPTNKHKFTTDAVVTSVLNDLNEVDIALKKQDLTITALSQLGPYVVALRKDAAEYFLEEGGTTLVDETTDPPVAQAFNQNLSTPHQMKLKQQGSKHRKRHSNVNLFQSRCRIHRP